MVLRVVGRLQAKERGLEETTLPAPWTSCLQHSEKTNVCFEAARPVLLCDSRQSRLSKTTSKVSVTPFHTAFARAEPLPTPQRCRPSLFPSPPGKHPLPGFASRSMLFPFKLP